jgi:endonuclease-8
MNKKKVNRSFYLAFANGEINCYVVSAQKLEKSPEETYDWRTDVLSKQFDKGFVKSLLKAKHDKTIDDVLMDQAIFSGVGNKIRNEALYRAGIHPLSITGKIPPTKIIKLINEVVNYAKIFYDQLEKKGVNDFFQVYQQEYAADGSEVTMKILPKSKRKIFFSEYKQQLFV